MRRTIRQGRLLRNRRRLTREQRAQLRRQQEQQLCLQALQTQHDDEIDAEELEAAKPLLMIGDDDITTETIAPTQPLEATPPDTAANDSPADDLARAIQDGLRWQEARAAKQRAIDEQREREAEQNAAWRRGQFSNYVLGLAFPDLNPMTGRLRSSWDSLPPPPQLYR